jgi:hypothetical protein
MFHSFTDKLLELGAAGSKYCLATTIPYGIFDTKNPANATRCTSIILLLGYFISSLERTCLIRNIAFAKNAKAMKRITTKTSVIHSYTCKTSEFSRKSQANASEQFATGTTTFNTIPVILTHSTFLPSLLSLWFYGFRDSCRFNEVDQYLTA